jgi:hypothetical protein
MAKFKAFFNGKTVDLEADSLYQAKQKALAHFKPRKKDEGLVAVVNAEQPIDPASLG